MSVVKNIVEGLRELVRIKCNLRNTTDMETSGFVLCMVSEDKVSHLQDWLESDSTFAVQDFLRTTHDHCQAVCHWVQSPKANQTDVMVCMIEPVFHHVIGMPVVPVASFQSVNLGLATPLTISNSPTTRNHRLLRIPGIQQFSVRRDDEGKSTVHLSTANRVEALSTILDNGSRACGSLVLLRDQSTPDEHWQSVHISSFTDTKSMVEYISGRISDETNKEQFLQEVERREWQLIRWREVMQIADSAHLCSNLQPDDSTSNESDEWVVIKCFVPNDEGNTMEELQSRFASDATWRSIRCSMTDGRSMLHISILEGATRAVIFLIYPTDGNMSLQSDVATVDTEFKLPSPHEAALNDDHNLLEWLMQTSTSTAMQLLQHKDEEGYTLLHAACRVGSFDVVNLLASEWFLPKDCLHELIQDQTTSGDTALHIAINCDYPILLHHLLKAVDRIHRPQMMSLQNGHDETPGDITCADPTKYKLAAAVLKYHRWISDLEFERFFTSYDYSLLGIQLSETVLKSKLLRTEDHNMLQIMQHKITTDQNFERGEIHCLNFDTAIFLKGSQFYSHNKERQVEYLKKAQTYNDAVLAIDNRSIHAVANRAMCFIYQQTATDVKLEVLAHTVLELQIVRGKHHYMSVVDYAFSSAESVRSEESRLRSCKIFTDALREIQALPDSRFLSAYCTYFHAKVLIRRAQARQNQRNWELVRNIVNEALECLITLFRQDVEEFNCDLWIWLAELQSEKVKRIVGTDFMRQCISRYQREVGMDEYVNLDIAFCINQGEQVMGLLGREPRFVRRIAKQYLDLADGSIQKNDKINFFTRAIDVSNPLVQTSHPLFMGVTTNTKARMSIWGIRFYELHKQEVDNDFYECFGHQPASEQTAWKHAANAYFGPVTEDIDDLLKSAVPQLSFIVTNREGANACGERLARVKALLGEATEDVKRVFLYTLDNIQADSRVFVNERFGRYLDVINSVDEAMKYYKDAVDVYNDGNSYRDWEPRLSRIRISHLSGHGTDHHDPQSWERSFVRFNINQNRHRHGGQRHVNPWYANGQHMESQYTYQRYPNPRHGYQGHTNPRNQYFNQRRGRPYPRPNTRGQRPSNWRYQNPQNFIPGPSNQRDQYFTQRHGGNTHRYPWPNNPEQRGGDWRSQNP